MPDETPDRRGTPAHPPARRPSDEELDRRDREGGEPRRPAGPSLREREPGDASRDAPSREPPPSTEPMPYATLRLRRDFVEAARDEAELLGRSTGARIEHRARRDLVEAARGATPERVGRALRGRLPIEALNEGEQDAVFDRMLDAYADPPAGVRERLAGIARRTRRALGM